MQLDRDILDELIELLTPLMQNEQQRRALLTHALLGSSVLQEVDFTGPTRTFIIRIVDQLVAYGEIKPGQPALVALLDVCKESVGWDKRQRIDTLINFSSSQSRNSIQTSTSQTCSVCGKSASTRSYHCPSCGSVYRPAQLGELYGLPTTVLQAYLKVYQPRTIVPNPDPDDLLAVALVHIMLRSFDAAQAQLERLLQIQPTHAYAWYALALAGLQGKRPRLLMRDKALLVQTQALNATRHDAMQAHAALLLALVKDDYFRNKGFRIDDPDINECLTLAGIGQTTASELRVLLTLTAIPDGQLVATIRAAVNL